MTVFCPNCGKPNTNEAKNCIACGTELNGSKQGSKFKGTMMMSGMQAPPGPGAGGAPPAPAGGAPGGGDAKLPFQQTMLGPMTTPGGDAPAATAQGFGPPPGQAAPAAPAAPAADAGFGAPPAAGGSFGAPPPGQGFGSAPEAPAAPAADSFGSAPAASGFGADANAGGGFGGPPAGGAGGGFGGPPSDGGFGGPPSGGDGGGFAGAGAPPPMGAPGVDEAAAKKKKTMMFVGIGCLALLLISCVSTIICRYACASAVEGAATGGNGCTELQACCDSLSTADPQQAAIKTQCGQVVAQGQDLTCGMTLQGYKSAGLSLPAACQ